jgi:hypothetical protein
MLRIRLLALVGAAIVVFPTSALASGAHHKKHHKKPAKAPAALKAGTYKATFTNKEKFNITLAGAKVSLPISPRVSCNGPVPIEDPVGSFVAPAALSAAGSVTQQAPITAATVPGEPPLTGQSTFSVTFTKKGTASGYFEESLAGKVGSAQISCTSGKVSFTAKLG